MYPVIFGLEGHRLSAAETAFLKDANPAGIILFARNIDNPDQVRALTGEVRSVLGRDDMLIFIDQEGGRVQRLNPPHWRQAPPMGLFGKTYAKDPESAERALDLNCRLLALELQNLGITADCLPVLDVPAPGAHVIVGDRAFSADPEVVARLGRIACEALRSTLVFPVIKHIPGHGRAAVDSHKALPVVDAPLAELEKCDFIPFRALNDETFAMTAHVTYSDIDPDNPATLSKTVIDKVIRGSIGFNGLLISDDINMKALSGSLTEISENCLAAGIDLVLHCSGEMAEMEAVMKGLARMPSDKGNVIRRAFEMMEGLFGDDYFELLPEYQVLEKKLKGLV